jgi:hypothetical protein
MERIVNDPDQVAADIASRFDLVANAIDKLKSNPSDLAVASARIPALAGATIDDFIRAGSIIAANMRSNK